MDFILFDCNSQSNQSSFAVNSPSPNLQAQQRSPQYVDNNKQHTNNINGQFIPLVSISENSQLILCQDARSMLRGMLQEDIVFTALIQTFSNGQTFDRKHQKNEVYSINMLKKATAAKNGQKVYLLRLRLDSENQQNSQKTERLLAFLIFLSSNLVIHVQKCSDLRFYYFTLSEIRRKQIAQFWPEKAFLFYQNLEIRASKQMNQLQFMFKQIRMHKLMQLSLYNQLQKIAGQTTAKKYKGFKVTGCIFYSIILNYCFTLNKAISNTQISLKELFKPIIQEIYQNNYLYITKQYDISLKAQFQEQRPFKIDQVIDILGELKSRFFERLHLNIQVQLQQKYEQVLEDHIDQKQRLIIEVNKKKCQFYTKKVQEALIQQIPKHNQLKQFQEAFLKFSDQSLNIQHGSVHILGLCLSKFYYALNHNYIKSKKELQKYQKKMNQRQVQLKTLLKSRQQQYSTWKKQYEVNHLKFIEQQEQRKRLIDIQCTLKQKVSKLKIEVKQRKLNTAEDLQQKLNFLQKIDKLVKKLRDMEQKERQNAIDLQQIRNSAPYKQKIEKLNRELSQLQLKCEFLEGKRSRVSSNDKQKKPNQQNEVNITFFQR